MRSSFPIVLLLSCIVALLADPPEGGGRREKPAGPIAGAPVKPAAASTGPCPVSEAEPCVIDLHGPRAPAASSSCASQAWSRALKFTLPGRWADSDKNGWWETVVMIPLNPAKDCGCARLRIFFDGPNVRFNVNVGDSPTNNGYGGDSGTTRDSAELQIQDGKLSVFSAVSTLVKKPTTLLDNILALDLPPLSGRVLQLEVCDQSLEFDLSPGRGEPKPLHGRLMTLNAGLLYALAPRPSAEDGATAALEDPAIYAAFNRVIHATNGAPSHGRTGSGVRRVEITLTP